MTTDAMCLSRLSSGQPDASQKVLPTGDWLEVEGVGATPNTAEVIEIIAIRDRASEPFIGKPVDVQVIDLAVPARTQHSRPDPTRAEIQIAWPIEVDVRPQSFFEWLSSRKVITGGAGFGGSLVRVSTLNLHRESTFPVSRDGLFAAAPSLHFTRNQVRL
jgi:hypothetical protein